MVDDAGGLPRPPMRVYGSPKLAKKRRRWLRVLMWTGLGLGVMLGGAAGAVYWWLQNAVATIGTPRNTREAKAQEKLAVFTGPVAKTPVTMLMVGYQPDERTTDTIILVRLDPATHAAAMMSIPRDWLVDVPGYGTMMINAVWGQGGPSLLISTLQSALGITPNYYVPVNFSAFIDTVDAFHGVYLDIDHRYYSTDPTIMNIDLQPGYQRLRGYPALTYVRWRHTDNDNVFRVSRQQAFLREFKRQVDPVGAAENILGLVQTAERNLRIIGPRGHSMDLSTIIAYLNLLRGMGSGAIVSIPFSGHPAPSDPNRVVFYQSDITPAVAAFEAPDPTLAYRAAVQTAGVKTRPVRRAYDPTKVVVELRNGSGKPLVATSAATALAQHGWPLASENGSADRWSYFDSVVYYTNRPGAKAAAASLAALFQPSQLQPLTPAVTQALAAVRPVAASADDVVVIGSTFDTIGFTPQAARQQPLPQNQIAPFVDDQNRDLQSWQQAQKQSGLALMMPTKLPTGTTTGDPTGSAAFRVYGVNGAAVHVTYYVDPTQSVFGVQALAWGAPPILQKPTTTRVVRGITYRLYFYGGHLHRVAWLYRNTTMWLDNSIIDAISNSTMWRLAISFQPVH